MVEGRSSVLAQYVLDFTYQILNDQCMEKTIGALAFFMGIVGFFGVANAVQAAAPVISDITEDIGITSTTITWTTDILASGKLEYGTVSGQYTETIRTISDTFHEAWLSNLTPETTYYYLVTATTPDDLSTVSEERSFTTESDTLKLLKSSIIIRGPDKIIIKTTLNKRAVVRIDYGTSSDDLNTSSTSTSDFYVGKCGNTVNYNYLKDLKPSTRYYYRMKLVDSEFCSGTKETTRTYSIKSVKTTGMPIITSVTPKTGKTGTKVTIKGKNFGIGLSKGHTPVDAVVSFGCPLSRWLKVGASIPCLAYIESWSDTKIVARVLKGSVTGPVYIGKAFTGASLGVTPENYLKMFVLKGPKFIVK